MPAMSVPPLPSLAREKLLLLRPPWMCSVAWALLASVSTSTLLAKVLLTATNPVRSIVSPMVKPVMAMEPRPVARRCR